MKSWLGLVVAPSVALVAQSIMYSMVTPACSTQTRLQLHLVAAVALAIVAVLAVFAFAESSVRRGEPTSHDSDVSDGKVPSRFLATMSTAVTALSALVILGMWFTLWVLTPCEP
jgi:hypothetical protein